MVWDAVVAAHLDGLHWFAQVLLTARHVLCVIALDKSSVAALNAVYQIQVAYALVLTVVLLGGRFSAVQALGIGVFHCWDWCHCIAASVVVTATR